MGTDNLFHKRRRAKGLKRRQAGRVPYEKVLIVCEGTETEANYFNGLRDKYRLSSVVVQGKGISPTGIIQHAKKQFEQTRKSGDSFDKVFCVFDKNTHKDYKQAINTLENMENFEAIFSVPAFEYWLLLHFKYSAKPYNGTDEIIRDLKKYLPEYTKGQQDIFDILQAELETAKENAECSLRQAEQNKTDNPSTHVHELVEYLQGIKNT